MEYLVVESRLAYAVVMDRRGKLIKVPNLGYEVGQTVDRVILFQEEQSKKTVFPTRWLALAACICLILFGGYLWQMPVGTVQIQINPHVRLAVNQFDRVIGMDYLNADGSILLNGYHGYGRDLETAVCDLADRALEMKYLDREGDTITLTVESKQKLWITETQTALVDCLEQHLEYRTVVAINDEEAMPGTNLQEAAGTDRGTETSEPVKTGDERGKVPLKTEQLPVYAPDEDDDDDLQDDDDDWDDNDDDLQDDDGDWDDRWNEEDDDDGDDREDHDD